MKEKIAAIILAAGASIRLGHPKQLLQIAGENLLLRVIAAARDASCAPIIVVVGASADNVVAVLPSDAVDIVRNSDWPHGIGTSIRAGISHAIAHHPSLDAAILMTCDQPLIDSRILRALIDKFSMTQTDMVASRYAETLGVPALFARARFHDLLGLRDNEGAKSLLLSSRREVLAVPFPGGAVDIDTPNDVVTFASGSKPAAN